MAEANGNGNGSGTMTVKLSWGVSIQLMLILVAIGIAWGTLTTRMSALETASTNYSNLSAASSAEILRDTADLRERVRHLEDEIRRGQQQQQGRAWSQRGEQ